MILMLMIRECNRTELRLDQRAIFRFVFIKAYTTSGRLDYKSALPPWRPLKKK